jgi:hypothetical protein
MVVYPMVPNLACFRVQIPTPPVLSVPMRMRRKGQAGQGRKLLASADPPLSLHHLVQLMPPKLLGKWLKVGLLLSQIKSWTTLRPKFLNLASMGDDLYPASHSIMLERRFLKAKLILVIAR